VRFTYRLSPDEAGWVAECVEATAAGEGMTAAEAVSQLREALEDRMRPEAVAPPSSEEHESIELAPAEPRAR
jgi:hypothetical protein